MASNMDFDWVVIDGPTCGLGHELTYPPAIEGGTYANAICETCKTGEAEFQIDGYSLWCSHCEFFVTTYFGECPNDGHHRLSACPN